MEDFCHFLLINRAFKKHLLMMSHLQNAEQHANKKYILHGVES